MTIPRRDFVVKHKKLSRRSEQDLGNAHCTARTARYDKIASRFSDILLAGLVSPPAAFFIVRLPHGGGVVGMTSRPISPFSEGCKY